MESRPRRGLVSFVLGLAALLALACPLAGQGGDIGTVTLTAQGGVRPVAVTGDAALVPLAQRALGLHGGIRVVADGASTVRAVFTSAGAGVRLVIEQGQPPRPTHASDHGGADRVGAVRAAADAAVMQLTGSPGFARAELAFVGRRQGGPSQVYVGDILFQGIRQVTAGRAEVLSPSLAPGGASVLFTSYERGFPEILGYDLRTRARSSVAAYRGNNTGARHSPRGDRVAMILSPGGNAELFTASPSGAGLRRLTQSRSLEADPSWSPDGAEIVYAADPLGKPQLFVVSAAGGTPRRLPTNISGYCAEPDWNPVQRDKVVFTAAFGGQFKLALWSFAGGRSEALPLPGAADAVHPAWLPDGRHVVYTERTPNRRRLAVYDTVTRRRTAYLHSDAWGDTEQASPR